MTETQSGKKDKRAREKDTWQMAKVEKKKTTLEFQLLEGFNTKVTKGQFEVTCVSVKEIYFLVVNIFSIPQ